MAEGPPNWRTGKLCYIEIPAVDVARSAEFYHRAFGWKLRQRGDGSTSFDDTVGEVTGTFVTGRPPATEPGLLIYIMVANLKAAIETVKSAGGNILRLAGPAAGELFAWFADPAGNTLGLYQQPGLARMEAPDNKAQPADDNTAGHHPAEDGPAKDRAAEDRPGEDRAAEDRPGEDRAAEDRPAEDRPAEDRPAEDGADIDRMLDLTTPWCLMVAATLRIPDHVAAGHHDIGELAAVADCDRDALQAVLGYLVSKGVFLEHSPGRFTANRAAERLADPKRFLDLEGIGGRMAHTWGTLLDYVRTGQPAYQKVFGRPFWEDLAANPKIAADFDALMGPAGHGVPDFDIELTGGWEPINTVVDVGGGTGAMLAALLLRHPHVRGVLVDLPGTVARAAEVVAGAGVATRVTVNGQSFFDPLPAGADLYLLKSVLNDWPDEQTVAILRRCAEAARPDGKVVVLGGVSPDDAPRVLAVDMLVAGGKTSTVTQFKELARRAGLEILVAGPQASGRFVVECRPATTAP